MSCKGAEVRQDDRSKPPNYLGSEAGGHGPGEGAAVVDGGGDGGDLVEARRLTHAVDLLIDAEVHLGGLNVAAEKEIEWDPIFPTLATADAALQAMLQLRVW